MSQRTQALRHLPPSIWALGFVSLLMDVSSEMIHSLLPVFMVTVMGTSVFMVGLIEGAAEATALIVKVFSGVLSDYWGKRKPLAVFGYSLGALSKPLFALAPTTGWIFGARLMDRLGKGLRGAPRDALVADLAPPQMRGAAFGLRQALDTTGAFLGPVLATVLMLLWANDFRAIFWVACVPAVLCVVLLVLGVQEPAASPLTTTPQTRLMDRQRLARLGPDYWWVVAMGAVFTLGRFSEAFLVLRAQQGGLALAWTPLVLIGMNLVYAGFAFPFGKLADSVSHRTLLGWGLLLLIAADVLLAYDNQGWVLWLGIALWGFHMAMTQGLLATMVAATAPADLRGTAYGFFNLLSGLALLVASVLAGWLWDQWGARFTFMAGAGLSLAAWLLLVWPRARAAPRDSGGAENS